jgi:hypothetical protein
VVGPLLSEAVKTVARGDSLPAATGPLDRAFAWNGTATALLTCNEHILERSQ